jgi:hypothetical protein
VALEPLRRGLAARQPRPPLPQLAARHRRVGDRARDDREPGRLRLRAVALPRPRRALLSAADRPAPAGAGRDHPAVLPAARPAILNTYWALILPYTSWPLALTIYLLRSYYLTLERELEDAARIDGANLFQTYAFVMFPLVRPALATVVILNLVNLWNELLFAMLFIQNEQLRTLPAGLLAFSGYYLVDYRLVFAALSITTVPILVVYFVFQRHVIAGLTTGALD